MNYVDQKYISLLSSRLEGFTRMGNNINCRCPLCGDSKKDKKRRRGWLLVDKEHPVYYCHNCGASLSFANFLKEIDPNLYKEYIYEMLKEQNGEFNEIISINVPLPTPLDSVKKKLWKDSFLSVCDPVNTLPADHKVNVYLNSRMIPENKRGNLFYIDNVQKVHEIDKDDKYKDRIFDEDDRLVMPFWSKKSLIGMSCRALDPEAKKRYLIFKFDEDKPSIYNLYDIDGNLNIDPKGPVYVTEGAIDSLFLDNAIACNGSDLMKITKLLKDVKLVFIPDNEPRNKEIVRVYKKVIDSNNHVVIFPKSVDEKDVNNMVMRYGHEYITDVINNNVFIGASAQLHLNLWKRI